MGYVVPECTLSIEAIGLSTKAPSSPAFEGRQEQELCHAYSLMKVIAVWGEKLSGPYGGDQL